MNTPPETPALTSAAPVKSHRPSRVKEALRKPAVRVGLIALAVVGAQWWDTHSRISALEEELAKRLAAGDSIAQESRTLAKQGQETLQSLQGKVGALEARLAETQSQQVALESMYQELSRSRDERLLAEIEQSLAIAAQQLQLAGNVEAALIALQSADARLARANQPQLLPLRKLITRDMDRLKSLPNADISGIALKLESLVASADSLPLAFEQRPVAAAAPAAKKSDVPAWRAFFDDVWQEARQLIRIERVDRTDPALISPNQAFFLRENLKLRLVNARLALLSRDGRSFREDMRQSGEWLDRYFDNRSKPVQIASANVKSLAALDIARDLPSLDETLNAVRNYKTAKEKR
ncbi:MAG TPA: uroporphyrinogen-III C-methyltransferase [Rhodocyclaceae bacterium]|nr:uroporphyrinogen-III C-methyltransferase [Rhodocyclaceae bacterium]